MQCSPPISFTGVSMSSIAIYSSPLSRLNKGCRFPGNPPNMSSDRLCPRSRNSDEEHDLAALRKDWAPYAELQRRKAAGRQGFQGQRRASGDCGVG